MESKSIPLQFLSQSDVWNVTGENCMKKTEMSTQLQFLPSDANDNNCVKKDPQIVHGIPKHEDMSPERLSQKDKLNKSKSNKKKKYKN